MHVLIYFSYPRRSKAMATAVITTTNSSMMGLSPGHASSHIWMQDGTQSIELSVNPTAAHLSPRRNIHVRY